MGRKLLHLLVAALVIALVTFPLVGLRAGPEGFSAGVLPSLVLGLAVAAIGLAALMLGWSWSSSGAPVALKVAIAGAAAWGAARAAPSLRDLAIEWATAWGGEAVAQWAGNPLVWATALAVAAACAALALLGPAWPGVERTAAGGGLVRFLRALESSPARVVWLVLLVAVLASIPMWAPNKWIGLVLETLVYVTIATGLNIALGMTGLLVLGHAAFWAVGAYTFAMVTVHWHWNFWFALPAAGAAAALVGLILGLPTLRLRGDYLAIVTLGFGESIRWIIKNNSTYTGGDAGIPGSELPDADLRAPVDEISRVLWQPTDTKGCYWFALALAVACVTSVSLLKSSRLGRAMFALREDETAAKCMGINTVTVKLVAFMSAAVWAGLAGVIHPVYRQQVTPELFNFDASVTFVAMVVLGGLGSVSGSVLGAAVLWVLPALLRDWIPQVQDYRMLVFGAVLAAMMIVRPGGIVGGGGRTKAAA